MQLEIVALNLNCASLWCSSKALFFLAMKKMSCKRKKLSKVMKFMITQITRISIIINWKLRWNICIIDADVLSKVFYELLCNFLHQSPSSYLEVSISWKKKELWWSYWKKYWSLYSCCLAMLLVLSALIFKLSLICRTSLNKSQLPTTITKQETCENW